ncbi:hypothetical protein BAUCODRAFT_31167 [Baudoinia panamericana UAMH 10762]|uniref:Uncharacterized protein n=1 Tax=Baudoinia panamericana (strain UAMH 10762) TaxID=717646 RepID=M2NHQ9_BAUPA|nr:uncharacterized protein BAUCODRAFT_31167 [Baudoinia panamericana UAMH 10762]EMC98894.1 hypothetical protein BAUCODRAFT_31167 [Baudoinia panamericana UAMH 10762]
MAENAVASGGTLVVMRRPSFRKTLRDNESMLPAEYLEKLEEKRRLLDESIHKYIASKEREYKQYEKDLRVQARSHGSAGSTGSVGSAAASAPSRTHAVPIDGEASSSGSKGRTNSDSSASTVTGGSPFLTGQQHGAVGALLASGSRQRVIMEAVEDGDGESLVVKGLTDRRPSSEREKELVGLFTPEYLPALDGKERKALREERARLERAGSAPPHVGPTTREDEQADPPEALPRAKSDTAVQATMKRPVHLQFAQRTSSSGSSADGKLTSAMKSPMQNPAKNKTRMKRVSLAVGDSIVAPADNVPIAFATTTSTPSHSRTRSPESMRERTSGTKSALGAPEAVDFAKQPVSILVDGNSVPVASDSGIALSGTLTLGKPADQLASITTTESKPSPSRPASSIDPDGDLFDLEDEFDNVSADNEAKLAAEGEAAIDGEEDAIPGMTGRLDSTTQTPASTPSLGLQSHEKYRYDAEGGLIPEPTSATDSEAYFNEPSNRVENLTFTSNPNPNPGAGTGSGAGPTGTSSSYSSSSSQQPTSPGFRKPSVVADPVFRGSDYAREEFKAATEEIYGSSYNRLPSSSAAGGGGGGASLGNAAAAGGTTYGSLGESYMARHAEEMMRVRMSSRREEEQGVR